MILQERELKPLILNPPPNITRVVDEESFLKLLSFLERTPEFGLDVETDMKDDFYWRRVRTIQFGVASEQYVIDLKAFADGQLFESQGEYGIHLGKSPRLKSIIDRLKPYFESDKVIKNGVNLAFEYMCLRWCFGVRLVGMYDCMLAEKCIYAGLGGKANLKNYDFFAMDSMMERYFGIIIDKELQTSFTLDDELSDAQWEYAALDTRTPMSIKAVQRLIATGETTASLKTKGQVKKAEYLYYLDRIILGDNLLSPIKIENEAIGAFVDMHLHGERLDIPRWTKRTQKAIDELNEVIAKMDAITIPFVGNKNDVVHDEEIAALELKWKGYNTPTPEEVTTKAEISKLNRLLKKDPENQELGAQVLTLHGQAGELEAARKAEKEIYKKQCGDLKKRRTKLNNLKDKCEGNALINYGSDAQMRDFMQEHIKGLSKIEEMNDEALEKYQKYPIVALMREYHGLSKEVGTYGMSWVSQWKTKPCKEEGWLHPGDGRLHCEFNQYDAETGRSSSSKPNGQNLPQDKEVRSSFIADPLDESIRISDCCESESHIEDIGNGDILEVCTTCLKTCTTHAEEYVLVTADMSGAELRIIADDSGDEFWISSFARGEDLHSAGTELLYELEWPLGTIHHKDKETWTLLESKNDVVYIEIDKDGKEKKFFPCAYFAVKDNGQYAKQKCGCPQHKSMRDDNKSTNFLLAYGGGPRKLAQEIKKPLSVAKELMAKHEQKNPKIWAYLKWSGEKAAREFKSFDLFGRRRLLPEPTHERAVENCKEYDEEKLRLPEEDCERNINAFITIKGRKPTKAEEFECTHRPPTPKEISHSWFQMSNSIQRKGKNHRIQGTNASIAKIAMGCGYDEDGKPFLWHTLPKYNAKLLKFVHDELVVHCPKRYGKKVAELIGDAFKRAAALKMKKVVMEFDSNIDTYWKK